MEYEINTCKIIALIERPVRRSSRRGFARQRRVDVRDDPRIRHEPKGFRIDRVFPPGEDDFIQSVMFKLVIYFQLNSKKKL